MVVGAVANMDFSGIGDCDCDYMPRNVVFGSLVITRHSRLRKGLGMKEVKKAEADLTIEAPPAVNNNIGKIATFAKALNGLVPGRAVLAMSGKSGKRLSGASTAAAIAVAAITGKQFRSYAATDGKYYYTLK